MQTHEADEFVKFFVAMDKRFRSQFDFPVLVENAELCWILSRTPQKIYVAKCKKITTQSPLKGFRMATDRRSFRLYGGHINFYTGTNSNMYDMGPRRAEIRVTGTITNWIANAKTLLKTLGNYDEIRANLADPEITQCTKR